MRIDMLAVGNRCGFNITTKLALIEACLTRIQPEASSLKGDEREVASKISSLEDRLCRMMLLRLPGSARY